MIVHLQATKSAIYTRTLRPIWQAQLTSKYNDILSIKDIITTHLSIIKSTLSLSSSRVTTYINNIYVTLEAFISSYHHLYY